MDRNPLRSTAKNFSFVIKSGNYTKNIINAIKRELPQTDWKDQLIWTVERFNFKDAKHSQIHLIVVEYGVRLTFRTADDGTTFELTIPELATTPPTRKKFLGLF